MFVRLMGAVLRFQSIIHRDENTEISLSCTCPPLASCLNISAAISTSPPHRQLPVTSSPLTTFQSLMTPIKCPGQRAFYSRIAHAHSFKVVYSCP